MPRPQVRGAASCSAGVSLRDAVTMATINAARAGRVGSRHRGLSVGDRADLVRFNRGADGRLAIADTWLSGQRVYNAS